MADQEDHGVTQRILPCSGNHASFQSAQVCRRNLYYECMSSVQTSISFDMPTLSLDYIPSGWQPTSPSSSQYVQVEFQEFYKVWFSLTSLIMR